VASPPSVSLGSPVTFFNRWVLFVDEKPTALISFAIYLICTLLSIATDIYPIRFGLPIIKEDKVNLIYHHFLKTVLLDLQLG